MKYALNHSFTVYLISVQAGGALSARPRAPRGLGAPAVTGPVPVPMGLSATLRTAPAAARPAGRGRSVTGPAQ